VSVLSQIRNRNGSPSKDWALEKWGMHSEQTPTRMADQIEIENLPNKLYQNDFSSKRYVKREVVNTDDKDYRVSWRDYEVLFRPAEERIK